MLKNFIVITSIFHPTEAVRLFANLPGYQLVVVGDRKSPTDWACEGVEYLSIHDQEGSVYSLQGKLPFNHYCRKMLGYLRAIENGAQIIIDTDDDNLPKAGWAFPPFDAHYDQLPGGRGFVNIYQLFSDQPIWPRGLPLDLIRGDSRLDKGELQALPCKVGVWQGLADEDPDVDAIYRLTSNEPCYFDDRPPVVLAADTLSPYNSQNTATRRELFALLYLPVFVTFRFTDILRSLVAQPIMAKFGYQLGFMNATVVQKRNPHDYMKDFISEIPMYEHTRRVVQIVTESLSGKNSIESCLESAYEALCRHGIVPATELETLAAWLTDLRSLNGDPAGH
jgi:hypothetical protein